MKNFLAYFIQGLLLFIPLVITIIILIKLYDSFSGAFRFLGLSSNQYLNTLFGLIGTIAFIALLGALASSFVFNKVFVMFEEMLEHTPFVKHIYSPIKDFTNAFMGNKKRFNKPVLVLTNPLANIEEMGFITQEDLRDFKIKDKVAVYIPFSYSLSGKLLLVPKENIKPLDGNPTEVMKFIVSGGVTDVD